MLPDAAERASTAIEVSGRRRGAGDDSRCVPPATMASMPWRRMGPPVRNSPLMRMTASWSRSRSTPEYKAVRGKSAHQAIPSIVDYPALWPTESAAAEASQARGWQAHRPRRFDDRRRLGPRKGPGPPPAAVAALTRPEPPATLAPSDHGQERAQTAPSPAQIRQAAKNTDSEFRADNKHPIQGGPWSRGSDEGPIRSNRLAS